MRVDVQIASFIENNRNCFSRVRLSESVDLFATKDFFFEAMKGEKTRLSVIVIMEKEKWMKEFLLPQREEERIARKHNYMTERALCRNFAQF